MDDSNKNPKKRGPYKKYLGNPDEDMPESTARYQLKKREVCESSEVVINNDFTSNQKNTLIPNKIFLI